MRLIYPLHPAAWFLGLLIQLQLPVVSPSFVLVVGCGVQEGVVPGSRLLKVLFVCSSANAVTSPSLRHRWLSVSKAKSEADGGAFEVTSVSSSSKDLASRYVAVAVVR